MIDINKVVRPGLTRADLLEIFEEDLREDLERRDAKIQKGIAAYEKTFKDAGATLTQMQVEEKKRILKQVAPLIKFVKGKFDLDVHFYDMDKDCNNPYPAAYAWVITKNTHIYYDSKDEEGRPEYAIRTESIKGRWAVNCIGVDVEVSKEYLDTYKKIQTQKRRIIRRLKELHDLSYKIQRHLAGLPAKVRRFGAKLSKTILQQGNGRNMLAALVNLSEKVKKQEPPLLTYRLETSDPAEELCMNEVTVECENDK